MPVILYFYKVQLFGKAQLHIPRRVAVFPVPILDFIVFIPVFAGFILIFYRDGKIVPGNCTVTVKKDKVVIPLFLIIEALHRPVLLQLCAAESFGDITLCKHTFALRKHGQHRKQHGKNQQQRRRASRKASKRRRASFVQCVFVCFHCNYLRL